MPRRLTQLAVERAIEHGWDVMGDAFFHSTAVKRAVKTLFEAL
jgi:hypothetical protein